MSPTTTRVALRRAGTLLVAAALVAGPAGLASADPGAQPTPSVSTSATAEPTAPTSPAPSTTTEPSVTPTPSASASPSPSASGTPAAPAATPSAAPETVRGLGAAELAAAAGQATPQTGWAADFIARTLAAGGDHYQYPDFDAFDGGNTIDAMLGLAASGVGADQLGQSLDYLEANVGGYMGADYDSTFAGPTAKAVIGVLAAGGDPTDAGGLDLVAELQATEGAVEPGRFSDLPVDCGYTTCDYSNTIGQALGIIALVRAGEPLSVASVDFLVAQQCADGGFRGNLDAQTCVSDPDATAFAAQALVAAGAAEEGADALDWLAAAQNTDGSLENSDGERNANTTGVAAQAFAAGGRDADLAQAQAFLVTLQYDCAAAAALRGGIAFSAGTRSTTTVEDSDLRATGQATVGLAGESLLSAALGEGSAAGTTGRTCAPTPTTSGPPTTTTPTATVDPTEGSGSDGGQTPVASGPGSLAQTGSDLLWPVAAGLVLLLVGGLAVAASRRRGAHA
ncbi:LPXTG cell wall anchor domain-containing protein [Oryzobacter sp. R7]|uniref:LPXTG cell wall anchor domain-containing protein n=1 Tax=Oryzobacter faecalis TaxID=3388656 RepID=UPI00398D26FA